MMKYFRWDMNKFIMKFAIAAFFITGCAVVPLGGPGADKKAKKFSPPANMSYLYILRDSIGVPLEIVEINGKTIGGLSNETFFLLELKPDVYKVRIGVKAAFDSEAKGNITGWLTLGTASVDLLTKPGHMYFIRVEMPLTKGQASAILTILPIDEGKEYVLNFKRAKILNKLLQ